MRRLTGLTLLAVAAGAIGVAQASAHVHAGSTLCVQRANPQCYTALQAAVDAAHDGDTIKIGPGTFAGGVTITKSVRVVGTRPGATTISGGGPVLTIGDPQATGEPTVSIEHITITGGETQGGPVAMGGGIAIPSGADNAPGATVSLSDVVVTGNRVEPTQTSDSPSGVICPGGVDCPFAAAFGGGIFNTGALTIRDSVISDNLAGGVASDADGAGIWSIGTLVIANSVIAHNSAVAGIPNGRFAEGGGLFVDGGSLSVRNSVVTGNSASLTSALPITNGTDVISMNANSGGIHVGDGIPTLIANTTISGNAVSAIDPQGEPLAFDSAMLVGDSPLTMRATVITGNHVFENVATSDDAGPGGSVLELDGGGTIKDTRISGNYSTVVSATGDISVAGALAVFTFDDSPSLVTVENSVISGNTATATSASGAAFVRGSGVFNNSLLTLRNSRVSDNTAVAKGASGAAQGGGIWNGETATPPAKLTLQNTEVVRNSLAAGAGLLTQGGGLFTTRPVTLSRSTIARNAPDQCFGC